MSFNKNKAMRNAERYLTQGKIQAAINEYKQVVENDIKDVNSRNMLGDLYIKAQDTQSAVKYYQEVAEHYNSQGFAKKAIAIYNKIYRIKPDSTEVISKLAELYQTRGSIAEARKHYQDLASRYNQTGREIETLAIWEKIAQISPDDTEIYVKIADAYWKSDRKEEAGKAFVEAGSRLIKVGNFEGAATAFSRSLEVNPNELSALRGFVKSQIQLGYPEEAIKILKDNLEEQPFNRELNYLLMDCYFDMNSPEQAEELIVKLVERDPSNYPKLLELVSVYLENNNLDAATRILSMTSEHLLVGGESEQLLDLLNEVLARDPEHIAALRLLARYHGWQRDELELQQTLERLADSAQLNESIEDERYALSQYLVLVPHNLGRLNRLKEINELYEFENEDIEEQLLHSNSKDVPTFESYATLSDNADVTKTNGFEILNDNDVSIAESFDEDENQNNISEEDIVEGQVVEENLEEHSLNLESAEEENDLNESTEEQNSSESLDAELSPSDEVRLDEDISSIKFYIEQGYKSLAEKCLLELEQTYGNREEIVALRKQLPNENEVSIETEENQDTVDCSENVKEFEQSVTGELTNNFVEPNEEVMEKMETEETVPEGPAENSLFEVSQENELTQESIATPEETSADTDSQLGNENPNVSKELETAEQNLKEETETENDVDKDERNYSNSFDDFKEALGLDGNEDVEQDDFEEHYQHAVVYQEMGMLEQAIREFQDAVNSITPNDGTSRFLNCCTLIGHCFMQKEMPNLAVNWFERAFEISDLKLHEKLGLYYELGNAYYANEEYEKAMEQFELIYSQDVDYRDVGEKINSLREKMPVSA